jgi:hypothetical protein
MAGIVDEHLRERVNGGRKVWLAAACGMQLRGMSRQPCWAHANGDGLARNVSIDGVDGGHGLDPGCGSRPGWGTRAAE